jgi:DNA-binding response OmpR family regulator
VAAAKKPRLLIVTDAPDRLNNLKVALGRIEAEIVSTTPQGLCLACNRKHDLAVVDVGPARLGSVLKTLRANDGHSEIPVLVDGSRIVAEPALAGVLPKYRAMPCSPAELVTLVRRRTSMTDRRQARKLL